MHSFVHQCFSLNIIISVELFLVGRYLLLMTDILSLWRLRCFECRPGHCSFYASGSYLENRFKLSYLFPPEPPPGQYFQGDEFVLTFCYRSFF